MNNALVSINLVVHNGERYIRHCLTALRRQSYRDISVLIWDNNSTDKTREIVEREFPEFKLIMHEENLGMWPAQEAALAQSTGKYIVALSVDVMLHSDFVKNAVEICERDSSVGGLQAKVYRYDYDSLMQKTHERDAKYIDTCGFEIFRSRRVVNIGHGDIDRGQYNETKEVFAVEGAVPFFRRSALEDMRIGGHVIDHNYFWYGDDLDLAWRMRLFGWKNVYSPDVVAYHDRSTTKSEGKRLGLYERIRQRQAIPIQKRRLDWANVRFTIIKNDYIINILRDIPHILARECAVAVFTLFFEPRVLLALPRFLRLLPRMIAARREIMRRARVTPEQIHAWFS